MNILQKCLLIGEGETIYKLYNEEEKSAIDFIKKVKIKVKIEWEEKIENP